MKICYWGTFDREYPRNAVLLAGLRQNEVEVSECHFDLWRQSFRYNKLVLLSGLAKKLRMIGRALLGYPILICRYLFSSRHDAVVVGYLGHLDVHFLAAFAKARREPIVFDAFFSLYDAVSSDWSLAPRNSLRARLCYWMDWSACRLASLVLVDTQAQRDYFCREFGLAEDKVRWAYVGADDSIYRPRSQITRAGPTRVLYVGNYVPLHGVPVILRAAQLLEQDDVEFWLIGENHRKDPALNELLTESNSMRAKFFPWLEPRELYSRLCEADICLGIFGSSPKARRVIPGKAFLALAMGIPLVTGDSPAARELLEDGQNAILCEMDDSRALADAILRLHRDPGLRRYIGEEGRKLFEARCSTKSVGSRFAALIAEFLDRNRRGAH